MARKRKPGRPRKQERELGSIIPPIVFAIASLAIGGFLAIAAVDAAGPAGDLVYSLGRTVLGHGYVLLPIAFIATGLLFLTSWREEIPIGSSLGGVLLILSLLSLLALTPLDSGFAGGIIAGGLATLFGIAGATLFLIAFALIGAILLFRFEFTFNNDLPSFKLSSLFGNKQKDDMTVEKYESDEDEVVEEEEPTEEEEEEKEPSINVFSDREEENDTEPSITTFGEYKAPPIDLLGKDKGKPGVGDIKANANLIKRTFANFGINVEMDEVSIGPTVTRYAIKPAEGVRLNKIISLQNNLELALAAHPVRIEAPIPGKSLVGIEVPNTAKATVGLAGLLTAQAWKSDKPLLAGVGRDITGQPHFVDIAKMPHGLIAGATGSGKSVAIHTLITSLLYRNGPDQLRFIMVDPKRVELTLYNGVPHLLTPVITDPKKAILALKWAAKEMDRRYNVLEEAGCRDITSYHENVKKDEGDAETMPYIVVVVDELADIMQAYPRELEAGIVRLAQMSRAVGIHLVLSTQRPSVNVITGLIKANVPSRMALQVSSQVDSRTILDTGGAEKLLGAGDMLFLSGDMSKPIRIQTAFISETEVKKIVAYIKKHNVGDSASIDFTAPNGAHEPNDAMMSIGEDEDEDDLYMEAKRVVEEAGKASTSYLQRKLRVGYARAARLMDILEDRGVIGPADGSKPRDVLSQPDSYDTQDDEEYEENR